MPKEGVAADAVTPSFGITVIVHYIQFKVYQIDTHFKEEFNIRFKYAYYYNLN